MLISLGVLTAPSSGHQEHKRTKRSQSTFLWSFFYFIFLAVTWVSMQKTTTFDLAKSCSIWRHKLPTLCTDQRNRSPKSTFMGSSWQVTTLSACCMSSYCEYKKWRKKKMHAVLKRFRLNTVAVGHKLGQSSLKGNWCPDSRPGWIGWRSRRAVSWHQAQTTDFQSTLLCCFDRWVRRQLCFI